MWDWLSGIGDFFGDASGLLDAVYAALAWLYNLIVALFKWLVSALNVILSAQQVAIANNYAAEQFTWREFFKKLLLAIPNAIIAAHLWLEEHLGKLLDFLAKVKKWLDRFFKTYIKPFLVLIQRIRRFLLVLRLLHIKWAAALDRRLGQIESDVARVFLTIRGRLTDLISVVNAITNPLSAARVIAGTIGGRRVFAAMTRIWTGLPLGHFFPNHSASALPWEQKPRTAADLRDPLKNPPASVILSGLSVGDFFQPSELDPIPTLEQVDAASDTYIDGQVINQLLATEAALAAPDVGVYDPAASVEQNAGFFWDAGAAWAGNVASDLDALLA